MENIPDEAVSKKDLAMEVMRIAGKQVKPYSIVGKWLNERCDDRLYPRQRFLAVLKTIEVGLGVRYMMWKIGEDVRQWRIERQNEMESSKRRSHT